jgi:hypothetical protein
MPEKLGSDEKQLKDEKGGRVNLGRHRSQCKVCRHPQHQEIEDDWTGWASPSVIEHDYGVGRYSMHRHVCALGLRKKRQRNIRMALERMIEKVDYAQATSSAIVSAIQAYVKITSAEQEKENLQGANFKKLLERMSQEEREAFARNGSLPEWFSIAIAATPSDSQEGGKES